MTIPHQRGPGIMTHHMLSIVSTPIGNLGDITLRALATLKKCDAIVCEDTRVTGQLLQLLELPKKELISCHGYSNPKKVDDIIRMLTEGRHLVLVSDAGTPGISDPGYALVSRARCGRIPIEVIPGPAAFLAALSASGLPVNRFVYLGFLPLKKGRQTLLKSLKEEERTIVFYESVHRIEKTLRELAEALQDQPDRPVVIARELTKMHEEIVTTTVAGLPAIAQSIVKKGEFAVIIGAQ
ncbi:MAG: uroporphyrin-III C/tetrapyrrole methyltransferase [Candidatus Peribacter riflensis]|uniref:Ribosomal RNA small subunit methyltransferase I n=1 Tax=Candidatus Peribacter riflensis TaxID=1735162 RepID=A0A0S1SNT8_9BACT|nr:MAG: uroporphyrin-III C/tetrapyrrole methyltransferase [Candidatus Peribacter riflensis]ALM11186.1 MAG: uroporphyrin-III C/tetrapyrrole methyltransferase [Candidatus Peribacter riflensis]ALM12289.1 MAG: 16S rRNA (cytidine1402-2'-O)-methyltransferase [Candidatus Peribacter riflensis]ALM13391.1 MAG: 16S rRNA (cytidine1402-2'-O)-methyltransferase [Candidatus Peribacter riflensis]